MEADILGGAERVTHVSPVKHDTTALPGGSLVLLLFVDRDPEPRYVMRVPRTPDLPDRLLTNFNTLRALSSVPGVADAVPHAVYCGLVDGVLASVETCVPGLPLAVKMRVARDEGNREESARLFAHAADWVWRLHASTSPAPCAIAAADMDTRARQAIRLLDRKGLLSDPQVAWLYSAARSQTCAATPSARIHGDFNPNNALLDHDGRVYVIDWEFSGPGWPLYDLFTLARTAWFHPAGTPDPNPAHAQALWDPRTPIGRVFSAALRRYEALIGLGRSEARTLFGLYVACLAADRVAEAGSWPPSSADAWISLLNSAIQP
jgi:aminoglycoside phosphotransferase (APT) family kinase protein